MRYLVSLDTKNNKHKLLIHSKKYYFNIFQGYIAYTMEKVNVNKIVVSWISGDANISVKFI